MFVGHLFNANGCYLGKMPDVNYSEVDFVNCTQDTLPGGRFIRRSTRGVCMSTAKRPLGIGLAHDKTNKQTTILALPASFFCTKRPHASHIYKFFMMIQQQMQVLNCKLE